ncbi:MAG: UDP-N-acetylmuramoyl-L-alanine--D-glutamate ligase [Gammaproteobacteria bacterium]|nr:UDP-N-acetylmuramoyl-L-alanine--D-glutamate ligase [Gammaproteobacteria bacterium]
MTRGEGSPLAAGAQYDATIVGLGRTGLACARVLHRERRKFAVTDSRKAPPCLAELRAEMPEVPVSLGGWDEAALGDSRQLIVSPGVDPGMPTLARARRAGIPLLGDVDLFCLRTQAPIVAVTGTNGKSTVVSLVAEMGRRAGLRTEAGGNIGIPAPELLDKPADLYVLELSSFQLETLHSLRAVAATVLNLSPDHLDRHGGMQEYLALKAHIYDGARVMVLNRDDTRLDSLRQPGRNALGFTLGAPKAEDFGIRDGWLARGERLLLPAEELRMPGGHNVANCLAALALGSAAGLAETAMLDALREFPGLRHRTQRVATHNAVSWYDDSKATNPAAAAAALRGLAGDANIVLIAGGEAKTEDFGELAVAAQGRVKTAILIGRDAGLLAQALEDAAPTRRAGDMAAAVRAAKRWAAPGDIVLLSPACASFDMYRDYRHRGDAFAAAVRELLPPGERG